MLTRDHALKRAKAMREGQIKMMQIARSTNLSWGVRYAAVIQAEDYEEAARRFDRHAERKVTGKAP